MAVFRTSARTVDMLGRQQIASVSTAISEVFKNANDAYATQVRADLLMERRSLLIRDDGIGMTRAEFELNWLTLATDNKAQGEGIEPPKGMERRPVLGAKGIGRLAIAVVGPHSLVLTRSRQPGSELVYAFVNWQIFSVPGVDLDQVDVPLGTLDGSRLPTVAEVRKLVAASRRNIKKVTSEVRSHALLDDLERFDPEAVELLGEFPGPRVTDGEHGTQFLISPVDDEALAEAADLSRDSELIINLVGFADTMTPGHSSPSVAPSLWVQSESQAAPIDVLAASEFLTVEEFWASDHQITGTFDERGTFYGEVRVYGGEPRPYELRWNEAAGPTKCGPFDLAIAIIQPKAVDSRMPPADHHRLDEKLRKMGGIYVYRHGIRVLPYGRPDVDWLDIEETRTKRLGSAFYSHRRMFGAVSITNDENRLLQEKAGREGFQQNVAYRQLRNLLRTFLRSSAADFFVKGGDLADQYLDRKNATQRRALVRRQREQQVAEARDVVAHHVATAYLAVADGVAAQQVDRAVADFRRAAEAVRSGDNPNPIEAEQYRAVTRLRDIERSLQVELPADIGLTRELRRDLGSYRSVFEQFESAVLAPARQQLEHIVAAANLVPARPNTTRVAAEIENRLRRDVDSSSRGLRTSVEELRQRAEALILEVADLVRDGVDSILRDDPLANSDELASDDYVARRMSIEHDIDLLYERAMEAVSGFSSAIDRVVWERDGLDIFTASDVSAAIDEEITELRESADESLDLVQLGMTLTILDHEFQLIIRSLRQALRELHAWADLNPALAPLIDDLGLSFEHLDSYLTLFTPLQRRLNRRRIEVTGDDIHRFVSGLFESRLVDAEIQLTATERFLAFSVRGFRSTWYPVFVNLLDNALYWVGDSKPPRRIRLDMVGTDVVVADSGRGVSAEDRDLIFEPRFTLKPGGRGLGLTISREVLAREGYRLEVGTDSDLGGAAFTIRRDNGRTIK